jgi:7,8-dihydropterin-6-yl-methyl-4-(beta-D-ribofuranosyl)aminobenzene 5'-phosphate synthase
MITLTCIVEDNPAPPLKHEHGLSVWIETPDGNALFDTGGSSGVLMHNMTYLGLDPGTLDAVALSHAHYDHTGGLPALLTRLPARTPLYAHPTLFRPRYSDHGEGPERKGLGAVDLTRERLAARLDLRLSAEPQKILPGVWTTGEITSRPYAEGRSARHTIVENGEHAPDPYADDLSLVLETDAGLFLLCGCCHAGLLNTLAQVRSRWDAPIVGIGGGTHLKGATQATLNKTVTALKALDALEIAWLGHCSGDAFLKAVQNALGAARFRRCKAGTKITGQGAAGGKGHAVYTILCLK